MRTQCRFHLSSPVVTIEAMAIFIVSLPIKIHTIDLSQFDKRVYALVSVVHVFIPKWKENLYVFGVKNQFRLQFFFLER